MPEFSEEHIQVTPPQTLAWKVYPFAGNKLDPSADIFLYVPDTEFPVPLFLQLAPITKMDVNNHMLPSALGHKLMFVLCTELQPYVAANMTYYDWVSFRFQRGTFARVKNGDSKSSWTCHPNARAARSYLRCMYIERSEDK